MTFWILLGLNEALGWALVVAFASARYWYRKRRLSWWLLAAIVVNELWLVPIALHQIVGNSRAGLIQFLVVIEPLILIFAAGLWFRHLDGVAQRLVDRVRDIAVNRQVGFLKALFLAGVELPRRMAEAAKEEEKARAEGRLVPDLEHARRERQGWYAHLVLYLVVQGVVQFLLRFTPVDAVDLRVFGDDPEQAQERLGWILRGWTSILIIDFFWSFSYTWWAPKLKPADSPLAQSTSEAKSVEQGGN
ncbi:MAG: hypothetical protein DIU79_01910 [Actinobacteria bacterium]|nr:MAG: hypothetical protein DIU79_01910 [Actinomycetota bacterium]